jgi:hypothetical protein
MAPLEVDSPARTLLSQYSPWLRRSSCTMSRPRDWTQWPRLSWRISSAPCTSTRRVMSLRWLLSGGSAAAAPEPHHASMAAASHCHLCWLWRLPAGPRQLWYCRRAAGCPAAHRRQRCADAPGCWCCRVGRRSRRPASAAASPPTSWSPTSTPPSGAPWTGGCRV